MSKWEKFRQRLMGGQADQNISFATLISYLIQLGFSERIAGDHHIFTHPSIVEIINLQPRNDSTAKPYQVKQVRALLQTYVFTQAHNEPKTAETQESKQE